MAANLAQNILQSIVITEEIKGYTGAIIKCYF